MAAIIMTDEVEGKLFIKEVSMAPSTHIIWWFTGTSPLGLLMWFVENNWLARKGDQLIKMVSQECKEFTAQNHIKWPNELIMLLSFGISLGREQFH